MTKKTCEVDGVTYEAVPQGEPPVLATFSNFGPCTGCVAKPAGQHDSRLCASLGDCVRDNIIWVVKQ